MTIHNQHYLSNFTTTMYKLLLNTNIKLNTKRCVYCNIQNLHRSKIQCTSHYFTRSINSASSTISNSNHSYSPFQAGTQGLLSLLTNQQRTLLDEQRHLSKRALDLAKKIGFSHDGSTFSTSPFLQQIIIESNRIEHNFSNTDDGIDSKEDCDDNSEDILISTFSVVIAGEFNAGMYCSSLIITSYHSFFFGFVS